MRPGKPTGDAECPPFIDRAFEIDSAINEKTGTRTLDDDEIGDVEAIEVSDTDDKENEAPVSMLSPPNNLSATMKATKASTFTARRVANTPRTTSTRATAATLLDSVATALDPSTRQARQDVLGIQYLQNNHILQLNAQVRDATRRIDSLTAQLAESERRNRDFEWRYRDMQRDADKAELMDMLRRSDTTPTPRRPPPSHHKSRPHYRQDIFYSDGGRATRWYGGDLSDDGDDIHGFNDSPGTRRVTVLDRSPSPSTPTHVLKDSSSMSSSVPTSLPPRMRNRTHSKDTSDENGDLSIE